MSERLTDIKFYRIPFLNNSYEHTVNFTDWKKQYKWFEHQKIREYNECSYQRKEKSIRIKGYVENFEKYNYMSFINKNGMSESNRRFYCFITDVIYINDGLTQINFEIDVIQTYMFDYKITKSLVNRGHVDRWNNEGFPVENIKEEGLYIGEYEIKNKLEIHKGINAYVMCTSTPLGKMNTRTVGGGGSVNPTNYKPSVEFCYMQKSFEGYSKMAYKIPGETNFTVGYGTSNSSITSSTMYDEPTATMKMVEEATGKANTVAEQLKKDSIEVNQNQFDAINSCCYNGGFGMIGPGTQFWTYLKNNKGNWKEDEFRKIFLLYVNPGTSVEAGLRKRRNLECDLFFNNVANVPGYGVPPSINVYDPYPTIKGTLEDNGGYGSVPTIIVR